MRQISLTRANLENANLSLSRLEGFDFTNANLKNANLKGIDFSQIGSCKNIKINSNTQVDTQWQEWLISKQITLEYQPTKEISQAKEKVNLKTITFETPKFNKKGEIISTKSHTAEYFTEILPGGIELEMVSIPGGTFWMGIGEGLSIDGSRHQVNVPSFYRKPWV